MRDVESRVEGATLAVMSGNLPKAERICREILVTDPDAARAHLILGVVTQRTGRLEEALGHLTTAHRLDPTSFDAASCLSAAYKILGQLGPSMHFAELAVKLKPNEPHALTELSWFELESLRLRSAEQHLNTAIRLSPDPNTQIMLGQCLERLGKLDEARHAVRTGLQMRSMNLDELCGYVGAMIRVLNPVCAAEGATLALQMAPDRLRARALPTRAMIEARRQEEALAILDDPLTARCAEAEHEDSEALAVLGMALQSFGRLEEARKHLQRAIQAPNSVATAFYAYTHCGRVCPEDIHVVRALEDRLRGPIPPDDWASLRFALGKAYEDLGEFAKAMEQYDAANNPPHSGPPRSPAEELPYQAFTPEFLQANSGHGFDSETPVFVVGMMRSGTTLAEQILSSHPQVGGAGEVPYWHFNRLDLFDTANCSVRSELLREAAERYVSVLSGAAPGYPRVVDKMPANCRVLGLLRLALPGAKFIHMRRSPIDTCLSIYATWGAGEGDVSHSKRSLVDMYRSYQSEMEHWRKVLPADRLLEINYEDLVTDPEPTVRRMVEFCGLEWNEACLHPEDNPRGVSTPSLWQVRRPINKGSLERWRRFEPWLGELRELL